MTLQQSVVDYITQAFNDKATNLSKDVSFRPVYLEEKVGTQFIYKETDPNRTYGKITKEYTPIIYTDFSSRTIPITGIKAEETTINMTFLIDKFNNYQDNLDVIEETLFDFRGRSDLVDGYIVGFNASSLTPPSPPELMNGKYRIPIDCSIYYIASQGQLIGNNISYYLRFKDTGSYNELNRTTSTTYRTANPDETVKQSDGIAKSIFISSVWQQDFTIMIDVTDDFYEDLITELENPNNPNVTYDYQVIYPHITYTKLVSFQSLQMTSNIGTFALFTMILKESGI